MFQSWAELLECERGKDYFRALTEFMIQDRTQATVYPSTQDVYRALDLTPLDKVRAVVLGQDPYHGPGQADGLAFSVKPGTRVPPSLRNIFAEYLADGGEPVLFGGDLSPWARSGVLLLNTVLTVREGQPLSHAGQGWEVFTAAVLRAVMDQPRPIVFLLWGKKAEAAFCATDGESTRVAFKVSRDGHPVIMSPHPSPLARGFTGSRPFSRANAALQEMGAEPINWSLR